MRVTFFAWARHSLPPWSRLGCSCGVVGSVDGHTLSNIRTIVNNNTTTNTKKTGASLLQQAAKSSVFCSFFISLFRDGKTYVFVSLYGRWRRSFNSKTTPQPQLLKVKWLLPPHHPRILIFYFRVQRTIIWSFCIFPFYCVGLWGMIFYIIFQRLWVRSRVGASSSCRMRLVNL